MSGLYPPESSSLDHCVLNGEGEMYIRYNSSSESNMTESPHGHKAMQAQDKPISTLSYEKLTFQHAQPSRYPL